MATRTWEGMWAPEEQAEPPEEQTSQESRRVSRTSVERPGKAKVEKLERRGAPAAGATAPGEPPGGPPGTATTSAPGGRTPAPRPPSPDGAPPPQPAAPPALSRPPA